MGVVLTLLTAVLAILKVLGVISMSWWWIILPAFIPVILLITILLSLFGLALMFEK